VQHESGFIHFPDTLQALELADKAGAFPELVSAANEIKAAAFEFPDTWVLRSQRLRRWGTWETPQRDMKMLLDG
jgi:hypothetical protein